MSNKTTKSTAKISAASSNTIDFSALDLTSAEATVQWMTKVGLEELEIEQGDTKIRLKRPSFGAMAMPQMPMQPQPQAMMPVAPVAATVTETATPAVNEKNLFKSPIVGTFYQSSSPDSAPFVQVGDKVKEGQTLCIVEAMKTMNQVEADRAGVVKEILVENAQPIEFGDALFVIE